MTRVKFPCCLALHDFHRSTEKMRRSSCEKAEANITNHALFRKPEGPFLSLLFFLPQCRRCTKKLFRQTKRNKEITCKTVVRCPTRIPDVEKLEKAFFYSHGGAVNWHCNQNPGCFTGGATAGSVMAMMPHVTGVPSNNSFGMLKTTFRNDKLVPEAIGERGRPVSL
ncbi:hypothetical protein B296_00032502 [Ensete ventricosum]|uniref:Uncharacterized protein n=1 Tax=Ensete ventricosum TaxID=4639 RepID=A0A426ZDZ7_ENSVE|nr:hypothetical protein B296_00032502 [Ensete ventricosum]